ncbi:paraquat-inducible protein A [Rhizobiales bacterium RZME27]|uniref:Paraquat-inducible protein A n=1 Tax=Endobacterium cereale TaxID=2663029 RepID=A0A6A8AF39_9HYPH|nr:paraquat-inducible protein A [Endobacterium cereale]MEB2845968.1 paraquat-inducible protein A [Endobacterium cereale]MQY49953.1 paraquat-inducible protein A [Endobacterium cereale]
MDLPKFLLILVAAVFLMLGLFLPIMRFDSFYFFTKTPSLVGIVSSLWMGGDILLALLVGGFSILFPILKLAVLALGAVRGEGQLKRSRLGRLMPHLSKWSMMDVMLVAIVVFAAKTSGLAEAITQPGLWFYAGSTLISAALLPLWERHALLKRRLKKQNPSRP